MSRTLLDADLRRWDVFASSGRSGYADKGRVVFRCASDPDEPSRSVEFDGDRTAAEEAVISRSPDDLLALLDRAQPLS